MKGFGEGRIRLGDSETLMGVVRVCWKRGVCFLIPLFPSADCNARLSVLELFQLGF